QAAVSINYCDVDHNALGPELDWHPLNITELAHPYPNSELNSRFGCKNLATDYPGTNIMENPLYSLPMALNAQNPAWKTCDVDVVATDPPRTLTRVARMGPPTTLPASPSPIKPAARISPQPAPTSRPAVDPSLETDPPQQYKPADPGSKPTSSLNSAPASPGGSPDPKSADPSATPIASGADALDPLNMLPSSKADPDPSTKASAQKGSSQAKTGPGDRDQDSNGPNPHTNHHDQPSTKSSSSGQSGADEDPDTPHRDPSPHDQQPSHSTTSRHRPAASADSDSPNQPPPGSNQENGGQISTKSSGSETTDPTDPILSNEAHGQGTQLPKQNAHPQPTTPVVIGEQTFSPGPIPITVAGATHSIAASAGNIIVNGHTLSQPVQLQPLPVRPPSVLSIGSQRIPFSTNSASELVVNSQTLHVNSHIIIASQTIALNPSATDNQILVNGKPTSLIALTTSPPTAGNKYPPLAVAGQTLTHDSAGGLMIGSHQLVPGGHAVTISGTSISIAPASQIMIDGSTIALSDPASTALPKIVVGGHQITQNEAGDFVIASSTLQPGGTAIIVSHTPISLAPSATQLIVGSSTIQLSGPTQNPTSAITFNGQTITANSLSEYVIAGQTLKPGGAITVSGTPLSLGSAASQMVIGSSTIDLSLPGISNEALRVGGTTVAYSVNAASDVVVAGSRTLSPGGAAITISGTVVSELRGSGSAKPEIVVGEGADRTTEALGNVIMNGFAPATSIPGLVDKPGGSNSTTGVESFTGDAPGNRIGSCTLFSLLILHVVYMFV
ncbi:MAG: hypothetical protein Q9191_000927, partial [Dirinaria sp. TL-2023a]